MKLKNGKNPTFGLDSRLTRGWLVVDSKPRLVGEMIQLITISGVTVVLFSGVLLCSGNTNFSLYFTISLRFLPLYPNCAICVQKNDGPER